MAQTTKRLNSCKETKKTDKIDYNLLGFIKRTEK